MAHLVPGQRILANIRLKSENILPRKVRASVTAAKCSRIMTLIHREQRRKWFNVFIDPQNPQWEDVFINAGDNDINIRSERGFHLFYLCNWQDTTQTNGFTTTITTGDQFRLGKYCCHILLLNYYNIIAGRLDTIICFWRKSWIDFTVIKAQLCVSCDALDLLILWCSINMKYPLTGRARVFDRAAAGGIKKAQDGGWRMEDGGCRMEVMTWPRNSVALTGSLDGQPSQTIPWLPVSHKNYIIAVSLTGHISTCTGAGDGCHGSTQRFSPFLQQIWIVTVVVFTVSHPSW